MDRINPSIPEAKDIIRRISCEFKGTLAVDQTDHLTNPEHTKILKTFGDTYGLNLPIRHKKDEMCTRLTKAIVEFEQMAKPWLLTDSSAKSVIDGA